MLKLTTKHIFIVDDNEIYSMMLDYILSKDSNYKFNSFKSGEECIEHLYLDPKIIILDYSLPGMNGYDTLLEIKKQNPRIHVVILTNNDHEKLKNELLKGGADDLVLKQEHGEEHIIEKIKSILDKEEKENAPAESSTLSKMGAMILGYLHYSRLKIKHFLMVLILPLLGLGLLGLKGNVYQLNEASFFINPFDLPTNNKDSAMVYYLEGIRKSDSLKYGEAIFYFTKALKLDSMLASAYISRAYAKTQLMDYQSALKDYDRALKLPLAWEESYEAYFNKGITETLLQNMKGAMSDFNSAIKLHPKSADAYYKRSIVKGKVGDYLGEVDDINKVIMLKPTDSKAYNSRGIANSMMGNYVSALMDYNKAIELDNKNTNAIFNRGVIYYELKEYLSALNDFSTVLGGKPDAGAYNWRGNTKFRMNNYRGAFEDFTASINSDTAFYLAYLNRGQLKLELKDYMSAVDDFTKAIEIKPDLAIAFYSRGLAKNKLNDCKGEIEDYTMALKFQPDFEDAYYQRGMAKYSKGDKQGGCDDLGKAVKQGSDMAYNFIIINCK